MMKSSLDKIEALLESDDELPLDYYEVAATPAYLIDSRFTAIQFNWINNNQDLKPSDNICNIPNNSKLCKCSSKPHLDCSPVLEKGVLLSHDLFCLKSVEGLTCDSTLVWLLNFLLNKDLQSRYAFLKGCLVSKLVTTDELEPKEISNETTSKIYKTVIKI